MRAGWRLGWADVCPFRALMRCLFLCPSFRDEIWNKEMLEVEKVSAKNMKYARNKTFN